MNLNNIINAYFPAFYKICNMQSKELICQNCQKYFYKNLDNEICNICANIYNTTNYFNIKRKYCYSCLNNDYKFSYTTALMPHEIQIKNLIYLIKNGDIRLIKYLSIKLAALLQYKISNNLIPPADILIPVPLSKEKLVKRGFNQSIFLTKYLAKYLKIPYRL